MRAIPANPNSATQPISVERLNQTLQRLGICVCLKLEAPRKDVWFLWLGGTGQKPDVLPWRASDPTPSSYLFWFCRHNTNLREVLSNNFLNSLSGDRNIQNQRRLRFVLCPGSQMFQHGVLVFLSHDDEHSRPASTEHTAKDRLID